MIHHDTPCIHHVTRMTIFFPGSNCVEYRQGANIVPTAESERTFRNPIELFVPRIMKQHVQMCTLGDVWTNDLNNGILAPYSGPPIIVMNNLSDKDLRIKVYILIYRVLFCSVHLNQKAGSRTKTSFCRR